MMSLIAPLTKLITGKAEVFTVIVTTLEAAVSMSAAIGHVFPPKET